MNLAAEPTAGYTVEAIALRLLMESMWRSDAALFAWAHFGGVDLFAFLLETLEKNPMTLRELGFALAAAARHCSIHTRLVGSDLLPAMLEALATSVRCTCKDAG